MKSVHELKNSVAKKKKKKRWVHLHDMSIVFVISFSSALALPYYKSKPMRKICARQKKRKVRSSASCAAAAGMHKHTVSTECRWMLTFLRLLVLHQTKYLFRDITVHRNDIATTSVVFHQLVFHTRTHTQTEIMCMHGWTCAASRDISGFGATR